MELIVFILGLFIIGLIVGALARLIVPGRDPMGLLGTAVLGIVGSFVGGFLGYILFKRDAADGAFQPAQFLGSLIGAIIALLVWRAIQNRGGRRSFS